MMATRAPSSQRAEQSPRPSLSHRPRSARSCPAVVHLHLPIALGKLRDADGARAVGRRHTRTRSPAASSAPVIAEPPGPRRERDRSRPRHQAGSAGQSRPPPPQAGRQRHGLSPSAATWAIAAQPHRTGKSGLWRQDELVPSCTSGRTTSLYRRFCAARSRSASLQPAMRALRPKLPAWQCAGGRPVAPLVGAASLA